MALIFRVYCDVLVVNECAQSADGAILGLLAITEDLM